MERESETSKEKSESAKKKSDVS